MAEKERSSEVREQIKYLGEIAEKKIVEGDEVFLDEPSRIWLKEILESTGVELSNVDGNTNLSQQAEALYGFLGNERAVTTVRETTLSVIALSGGGVLRESDPAAGDPQILTDFVEEYFSRLPNIKYSFAPSKYKGDGETESDWKVKVIYRIEAVVAVMNKLVWIMAGEGEDEGRRRQGTAGIGKHLRERVLRGYEKAEEKIAEDVTRYKQDDILRHLPKGGLEILLANMLES